MIDKTIPILIVDDDRVILNMIEDYLKNLGYNIFVATDPTDALYIFQKENIPILVVDVCLNEKLDGIQLLEKIRDLYPPSQVIVITGFQNDDVILKTLRNGACDYIAKPFRLEILEHAIKQCIEKYMLIRENYEYQENLEKVIKIRTNELEKTNNDLKTILEKTVESLARTIEIRDPYTCGHMNRVSKMAVLLSEYMSESKSFINTIKISSSLHDIGKIYIPIEILSKPSVLTRTEFKLIINHPIQGYNIVKDIPFQGNVANIILQHHERLDGSGYPYHLKDKDILPESNLIAICDTVEAIASHRPYRPSKGINHAINEIKLHRGVKYVASYVDSLIDLLAKYDNDLENIFNVNHIKDGDKND